jgi:hypothetical protein
MAREYPKYRLGGVIDIVPDTIIYSYNLIWTDPSPYKDITSVTSENCPGLD